MKRKMLRIDGYVWCEKLGEVHDDSLDPYEYGAPDDGEDDPRCTRADHVAVYARQDAKDAKEKANEREEEIVYP